MPNADQGSAPGYTPDTDPSKAFSGMNASTGYWQEDYNPVTGQYENMWHDNSGTAYPGGPPAGAGSNGSGGGLPISTSWLSKLGSLFGGLGKGGSTGSLLGNQGFWNAMGSVISYIGGRNAAKSAAKLTPEEKALYDAMIKSVQQQNEFGQQLIALARDPIVSSEHFLNAAANGDMNTMQELIGGDLSKLSEGARGTLQTMSQLGRTGNNSEAMSKLPGEVAIAQQGLVNNTKNSARSNLLTLGTNLADLGGRFVGGAAGTSGGLLSFDQNKQAFAYGVGSQTGNSIYNMFKNIVGSWGKKNTSAGQFFGDQPENYGGQTVTITDPTSGQATP